MHAHVAVCITMQLDSKDVEIGLCHAKSFTATPEGPFSGVMSCRITSSPYHPRPEPMLAL